MNGSVAAATAFAGLLGAVLGVLRYFNYRTNRDKQAAVGQAFETVVRGLGTTDPVQRLASAILLRRFFDRASEYAVRIRGSSHGPYEREAINVIAGVLRQEPTGDVQKLLADSLAYAPTLERADLQRTNLRDAYLSRGEDLKLGRVDVREADFHRADLSRASLKNDLAAGAKFHEARLNGTVFKRADLRGANFAGADLLDARFDGAKLADADFTNATNVPPGVRARLDARTHRFVAADDEEEFEASEPEASPSRHQVFLSVPNLLSAPMRAVVELTIIALEQEDIGVDRVTRASYSAAAPLSDIRTTMARCVGTVILCIPQLLVSEGSWREGTEEEKRIAGLRLPTPWNQIEAGLAAGLGLPILVIGAACSEGGILDVPSDGANVARVDLEDPWDLPSLRAAVRSWALDLPKR